MDDFGTGLRAHLGLDAEELEVVAEPDAADAPIARLVEEPEQAERAETARLDALAALEAELLERERLLAEREAMLASRAGSLLAAAQSLYDEVMSGASTRHDDELARLRQRKSTA